MEMNAVYGEFVILLNPLSGQYGSRERHKGSGHKNNSNERAPSDTAIATDFADPSPPASTGDPSY